MKEKSVNCARFPINLTLVLFGHDGKTTTDEDFDFLQLRAKFFMYKSRLNKLKPTLEAFINNKRTHLMVMTDVKFIKKWIPYNHLY